MSDENRVTSLAPVIFGILCVLMVPTAAVILSHKKPGAMSEHLQDDWIKYLLPENNSDTNMAAVPVYAESHCGQEWIVCRGKQVPMVVLYSFSPGFNVVSIRLVPETSAGADLQSCEITVRHPGVYAEEYDVFRMKPTLKYDSVTFRCVPKKIITQLNNRFAENTEKGRIK